MLSNLNANLNAKKRVLVAMSGGVDSSVAAALLVEKGYDVVGVTMQVWDYSSCDIEEGNGTCCSSVDVDDARAVADKLKIPFYVINCEAKFKQKVIDPFIAAYLEGKTPLPCVDCNTYLKFDHLLQKMRELNCDYLSTGHYAQIQTGKNGQAAIVHSTDDWKDQTYFLFTIDPEVIPKLIFPIGDMNKEDVRRYAEEKGLINARKKDSTGICFVGDKGYANFLQENVAAEVLARRAGQIRKHPSGEVICEHSGIHNFTYGQRRGLGFAQGEPLYVYKIEAETNTVWVSEEKYLYSQRLEVTDMHLLDQVEPGESLRVKVRFHHKGAIGRLKPMSEERRWEIEFDEPVRAITPGQAAVLYRHNQLVGGGWIV